MTASVHSGTPTIRNVPTTLWLGLILISICEVMLALDVHFSHRGPLKNPKQAAAFIAAPPLQPLPRTARWFAINMTPLVWPSYLIFLDGLLTLQTRASPIRRRPHHFATLFLASIVIWSIFDWINFYFIHAWTYFGLPPGDLRSRWWQYALAFGSVVPGMLLSGQVFLNLGAFQAMRGTAWRMPAWGYALILLIGVAMLLWPFFSRDPISNLTLWTSLVLLLDPINRMLGRPSLLADWQHGWFGRTLAAAAAGLLCGLLWEFWNFWALAKWTYHLPFLGRWETVRYFEMPVLGLLGFIPFGPECWVMWQTLRIPLDGLAEPLPDERWLI